MKALPFLLVALVAGPALAQSTPPAESAPAARAQPAQSNAMPADREQVRSCNRQARQQKLKRQEKRDFLKGCIGQSSNATTSGSVPPQPALQSPKP